MPYWGIFSKNLTYHENSKNKHATAFTAEVMESASGNVPMTAHKDVNGWLVVHTNDLAWRICSIDLLVQLGIFILNKVLRKSM